MVIRIGNENDIGSLIILYKEFFSLHNVFQRDDYEIEKYLIELMTQNELIVYDDNGEIKSAMFLDNFGQDLKGNHKLWKFKHFAFNDEDAGSELLNYAENKIIELSITSKIELTISKNEKHILFYEFRKYKKEGTLKNHYRWGEDCLILGKSLKNK
jgi:hypothetical protein